MRFPASDVKKTEAGVFLQEEGERLMTLLGYIDSLAEMSYYDEDPELLEYVERWEARQPKATENKQLRHVDTPIQITLATREECREDIKEELPDVYASAEIHRENIVRADQDLEEMVSEHQKLPVPVKPNNYMMSQRHLYEIWCRKLLRKERVPNYEDFGEWTGGWMFFKFGLKDPDELAITFGFGDLLPEKRRDPARVASLMYRGFQYSCDQKFVIENRDVVLAKLEEGARQREVARIERLAQRCAYQVTNATQITVDETARIVKQQLRREEEQRHEAEAELARARQAQQAKINRGRQEAEAARQARAAETRRRTGSQADPSARGNAAQGGGANFTGRRSQTTYTRTEFRASGRSTIFSSLGAAINTFVNGIIDIASEIFDGACSDGEPK